MGRPRVLDRADAKSPSLEFQDASLGDSHMGYLVWATHRALARALQSRLAPHGVNIGSWRFLRVLWERDGITERQLGSLTGMTSATTHLALRRMERGGLILRFRSTEDRRNVIVRLTELGAQLKEKLLPLAATVDELACKGMSEVEVAFVRRLLRAMTCNVAVETGPDADTEL